MSDPVCHLDEFFMTRVNIAWHDPKETTTVGIEHKFDYDVQRNTQQPNVFRLIFRFGLSSEAPALVGYELDTEIVGYFRFPDGTTEESMQTLVRYNGCTILYGILRGQVANISGSFRHPKLILPTVMMEEVVNAIETRKAEIRKQAGLTHNTARKKLKGAKTPTKK